MKLLNTRINHESQFPVRVVLVDEVTDDEETNNDDYDTYSYNYLKLLNNKNQSNKTYPIETALLDVDKPVQIIL